MAVSPATANPPIKVLVPIDGSDNALRALDFVLEWMQRGIAIELHILNVQPPVRGDVAAFVPRGNIEDYHREEGERTLQPAADRAKARGAALEIHIGVGQPAPAIADFVSELGIEHLVMGTRGLGRAAGLLLGSVATESIRMVAVPVTLVK
jgi:nucleotide-binding universal stress UspA family protein